MEKPEELQKQKRELNSLWVILWVIIALLISGGFLAEIFQDEQVMILVFILLFILFAAVLIVRTKIDQLEKRIPILQTEIKAKEKKTNESLINTAAAYLQRNPETSSDDWQSIIPNGDESLMKMGAKIALRRLLEQRKFDQARSLLDYYDADEFHLLPVMEALAHHEQSGMLKLSPKTHKIVLEDSETAYEKLPCNWQKIHTYLAPLEDEIEQADILDSGNIYITDQRVFFVGKKGSETVYLNDIAYIDDKEDALQFFRDEGLSEIFAFPTPHHATYARLVIEELMGR